jgi:integrase
MRDAAVRLGMARSSVCTSIPAAISHHFRYESRNPVDSVMVREMRKALSKVTPTPGEGRKPLLPSHLRKIAEILSASREDTRDFTMVVLMVFGFLRRSEVVNLKFADVKQVCKDGSRGLSIHIQRSKTDQEGKGAVVFVAALPNDYLICPVRWFELYCALVWDTRASFLFFPLTGSVTGQLSAATPNFIVKRLLERAHLPTEGFGAHSCRKGGCTSAVNAGADLRLVAQHGRWTGGAIQSYIKDSVSRKLSVSTKIANYKEDQ